MKSPRVEFRPELPIEGIMSEQIQDQQAEQPPEEQAPPRPPPTPELDEDLVRPKTGFFKKVIRLFHRESPKMYVAEGENLVENNNLALATIAFQKAISLDAHCKEAYKGLGNTYLRKGGRSNTDLALENFKQASKLDPFDEYIYALTAKIYERLRMLKEATLERKKIMIVKTLQTEPKNPIANNNMGILLLQQEQVEPAIKYFESSIAADPGYDIAYRNMAATYYKLGMAESGEQKKREHFGKSRAFVGKALNISRTVSSLLVYGKILVAESQFDDALTISQEVEVMEPSNKAVFAYKRLVLEKMNRTADAQQAFDSYQALADQTPDK